MCVIEIRAICSAVKLCPKASTMRAPKSWRYLNTRRPWPTSFNVVPPSGTSKNVRKRKPQAHTKHDSHPCFSFPIPFTRFVSSNQLFLVNPCCASSVLHFGSCCFPFTGFKQLFWDEESTATATSPTLPNGTPHAVADQINGGMRSAERGVRKRFRLRIKLNPRVLKQPPPPTGLIHDWVPHTIYHLYPCTNNTTTIYNLQLSSDWFNEYSCETRHRYTTYNHSPSPLRLFHHCMYINPFSLIPHIT